VRVVGESSALAGSQGGPAISVAENAERVKAMLSRRPCTLRDLETGLGLHLNEVTKLLALLMQAGRVEERMGDGKSFFVVSPAHRFLSRDARSERRT
jgi:hypothetical protein